MSTLKEFKGWLQQRGCSEKTAGVYAYSVKALEKNFNIGLYNTTEENVAKSVKVVLEVLKKQKSSTAKEGSTSDRKGEYPRISCSYATSFYSYLKFLGIENYSVEKAKKVKRTGIKKASLKRSKVQEHATWPEWYEFF